MVNYGSAARVQAEPVLKNIQVVFKKNQPTMPSKATKIFLGQFAMQARSTIWTDMI